MIMTNNGMNFVMYLFDGDHLEVRKIQKKLEYLDFETRDTHQLQKLFSGSKTAINV